MAIFRIAVIAIKIIVVVYYHAKFVILQICKESHLIITMKDLSLLGVNETLIEN